METLHALKEKITQLIDKIKDLSECNDKLLNDNQELHQKVNSLESALLNNTQCLDSLIHEKDVTKNAVDDLIRDIDILINSER